MTDFFTRVAGKAMGTTPAIQPLVVSRYAPSRLSDTAVSELETDSELFGTEPRRSSVHNTRERSSPTHSDSHSEESEAASPPAASPDKSFAQPVIEGDVRRAPPSVRVLPAAASTTHAELSENEMQPPATRPADNEEFALDGSMTAAQQTVFDSSSKSGPAPAISLEAKTSGFADSSKNLPALETNVESGKESSTSSNNDDETLRRVQTDLEEERQFQDQAVGTQILEREPGRLTRAPSTQANQPTNPDGSLPVNFTSRADESSLAWPDPQVERNSPVIRVSIGRIEVRAVTPAAEPAFQSSAPATPKISLEEFLREHNGRRP